MARLAAILLLSICVLALVVFQWAVFFADGGPSPARVLANATPVGPGTPTPTPRPTSMAPEWIVNDTGEAASYLFLEYWGAAPISPPDCGDPVLVNYGPFVPGSGGPGRALAEYQWATACIDPGEKVFIELLFGGPTRVWGYSFLPEMPAHTFSTPPGLLSGRRLTVPVAAYDALVLEQPASCPTATLQLEPAPDPQSPSEKVTVAWDEPCVGPGEQVVLHFMGDFGSGGTPAHLWTLQLAGDASCDGDTTSLDALLLLQYAAALISSDVLCGGQSDPNRDGSTDSVDALIILQYDAGLLT